MVAGRAIFARGLQSVQSWGDIVFKSQRMSELVERLRRIAASPSPLLFLGERGTGKTILGRLVHNQGPRARKPFVYVNCATITAQLAEAAFFGHEKGAFTGANERRLGYFEQANGGTLFLDEVGELPQDIQAQLLSATEYGIVRRVGADKELTVDVRLISATNRNLLTESAAGSFRSDLFDRIGVLRAEVPSLRERREDIPLLAQALYRRSIEKQSLGGISYPDELPIEAIERLVQESWPGNVRQLETAIINLVTFNSDGKFTLDDVNFAIQQACSSLKDEEPASTLPKAVLPSGMSLPQYIEAIRLQLVEDALEQTGGDMAQAAKMLRVTRQNIYQIVKRHRKLYE